MIYNHLSECKHVTDDKFLVLHSNDWNHFTVSKQINSDLF